MPGKEGQRRQGPPFANEARKEQGCHRSPSWSTVPVSCEQSSRRILSKSEMEIGGTCGSNRHGSQASAHRLPPSRNEAALYGRGLSKSRYPSKNPRRKSTSTTSGSLGLPPITCNKYNTLEKCSSGVWEEHEVLRKAELSCEADSENYLGGSSETRRRQLPMPPSDCFGTGREHKLNLLR